MPLDPGSQVVGATFCYFKPPRHEALSQHYATLLYAMLQTVYASEDKSFIALSSRNRVFAEPVDRLVSCNPCGPVLLFFNGRMYLLKVFDAGRLVSQSMLGRSIAQILSRSETEEPTNLSSLTALPKGEAVPLLAEVRKADPATLQAIDDAWLAFSIVSNLGRADGQADQLKGLTGEGNDRWFGKTTLLVDPLGHLGLYADHALADGLILKRLGEQVLMAVSQQAFDEKAAIDQAAAVQPVGPFGEERERRWKLHLQRYRHQLTRMRSDQASISVDCQQRKALIGAIPLAAQTAFYRLHGEVEAPYLPVSKRRNAARGLDFIHDTAPGTLPAILHLGRVDGPLEETLQSVLSWWSQAVRDTVRGKSGERLLHYLYRFAESEGASDHPFFGAAGFPACLAYPRLCLSVMEGRPLVPGIAFPPDEQGWGIGATVHENGLNVTLTAWDDDPATALNEVRCALEKILERLPGGPEQSLAWQDKNATKSQALAT